MAQVILCYRNILENSIVTVTSENTSFPVYRLYDRDIGLYFKGNSTPANFYITLNQGAVISYPVNRLIIPSGHNLAGLTLKLQYSNDNFAADNHDADSWAGVVGLISRSFAEVTSQYWRLNIAAPASAPELNEMFLGLDITLTQNPGYDLAMGKQENVERWEVESGLSQRVKNGEMRRFYNYPFNVIATAQKTDFETWRDTCDGRLKPFYLYDHEGTWVFVERLEDISFIPLSTTDWATGVKFLEVVI